MKKLLKASQAKKSEYGDSAKYVIFTAADKKGNDTDGKVKVTMNEELIQKSLELAGYNMLVTSEISMKDKDVYNAYHNLWRIEESFQTGILAKTGYHCWTFFNLLSGRITDKITAVQDIKKWL